MQEGDDEDDGTDPILDWEPEPPVEIPILDDALPYKSDVEDFWSKLPRIWPSL